MVSDTLKLDIFIFYTIIKFQFEFCLISKGIEFLPISNFLIPISLQHDGVNLCYFKLRLGFAITLHPNKKRLIKITWDGTCPSQSWIFSGLFESYRTFFGTPTVHK